METARYGGFHITASRAIDYWGSKFMRVKLTDRLVKWAIANEQKSPIFMDEVIGFGAHVREIARFFGTPIRGAAMRKNCGFAVEG